LATANLVSDVELDRAVLGIVANTSSCFAHLQPAKIVEFKMTSGGGWRSI
jgi:hypothetical protein